MTMKDENNLEQALALANDPSPPVQIWRRFRKGHEPRETWETLPEYLAELIIAEIRFNEPNVERAKIVRRRAELDYFLLSDLAELMAEMPAMEAA